MIIDEPFLVELTGWGWMSRWSAEELAEKNGMPAQEMWDSCTWVRDSEIGLVAILGGKARAGK